MNVREKIQEIEEKSADGDYIYRGEPENHAAPPYCGKVSSSLWRFYSKVDPVALDVEEIQKSILREARNYVEADKNDLELLAEIQHYAGKTNLIDFTTDLLIALFFACDGSPDKCGRVILLNRTEEIREKYRIQEPQTPQHRVVAQKSIFVQPRYGYIQDGHYCVIGIPKDLKAPMLEYLRKYHGIFARKIYNDLHGYIKHQKIHRDAYIQFGHGSFAKVKEVMTSGDKAMEHLSDAIKHFSKAITQHPDFVEAYHNRGQAYWWQGDYDSAINDFTRVIQLDPNYAEAYHKRGSVYFKKGDYNHSITDFSTAITLYPDFAPTYWERGMAYAQIGNHTRKEADYDRARELQKNKLSKK